MSAVIRGGYQPGSDPMTAPPAATNGAIPLGGTLAIMHGVRAERDREDRYTEDPDAVRALLRVESFVGPTLDPAAGSGSLVRVLVDGGVDAFGTDPAEGPVWDFTSMGYRAPRPVVNIVTNPPFRHVDEFTRAALELATVKVAIFCKLTWLQGEAHYRTVWSRHPPDTVHVMRERGGMIKGRENPVPHKGGGDA